MQKKNVTSPIGNYFGIGQCKKNRGCGNGFGNQHINQPADARNKPFNKKNCIGKGMGMVRNHGNRNSGTCRNINK